MDEDLSSLNLVELLDRLHTIPEPEPVLLLPQTITWLWIGLALLLGLLWILYRAFVKYRANRYRRKALQEITRAGNDPVELARIIRRTALAAYPRTQVAQLHGDEWLTFLDRTYPGNAFVSGIGRIISTAPYTLQEPSEKLASLITQWVKTHYCAAEKNSQ